jgi:Zn finger protein HypA/HybF involved in hydrogenase expression
MNSLIIPLLILILSSLTLMGVIFVAIVLWRIPKKCPQCGKKMSITSINLICNKCGFVESTVR